MKNIITVLIALLYLINADNTVPFFPNCYKDDNIQHSLDIGIAVDFGTYTQITQNVKTEDKRKVLEQEIENKISIAKVVYKKQFNIILKVSDIQIGDDKSPLPLSRSNYLGTCTSAVGAFEEMNKWNLDNFDKTGYWMLFSNCFTGITGVSYTGSICGSSNSGVSAFDWLDFAHELGHGIGAGHTFGDGGIMDYGDGKYNGTVQFYPGLKDTICPFLDYVSTRCPKYFKKMTTEQLCGDGILSGNEQCECLNFSKKCGSCINCQTTQKCSSSNFIVRNPYQDSIVSVNSNELSDKKCCINGVVSGPKTLCTNNIDVCSDYGRCQKVCSKGFGINTKVCGFDSSGCMQGCVFTNKCRFDLTIGNDLISTVPDNTSCIIGNTKGQCLSGKCIIKPVACNKITIKNKCILNKCKWCSRKCKTKC
jgi:hypothetical protein